MRANIAGYILAGGKGTRMGGMDKLSLKYQGRYLALWTIEALSMLDTWYVSVAEIPKEPMGKARWIRDVYEDIGPMGGILSGLIRCREEALFVVPCDTFGVDASMGRRLLDAYERAGRPVFFQDRNKIFPFPGIYTKSMLPAMERQRKAGIYRMQSLFDLVDRGKITLLDGISELGRLVNLNTWQEYESLQRRSNEREMRYGTRGAE